jgi:ArsR family transcriptional regulator
MQPINICQARYNLDMSHPATPYDLPRFFQALADPTRLRLLNLMRDSEICVCYFVDVLDQPQPKISRHLAYLRSVGLVSARREGRWMHYRITPPPSTGAARLLAETLKLLASQNSMQAEHQRLIRACCAAK